MDEALLIKPGFATPDAGKYQVRKQKETGRQLSLALEV